MAYSSLLRILLSVSVSFYARILSCVVRFFFLSFSSFATLLRICFALSVFSFYGSYLKLLFPCDSYIAREQSLCVCVCIFRFWCVVLCCVLLFFLFVVSVVCSHLISGLLAMEKKTTTKAHNPSYFTAVLDHFHYHILFMWCVYHIICTRCFFFRSIFFCISTLEQFTFAILVSNKQAKMPSNNFPTIFKFLVKLYAKGYICLLNILLKSSCVAIKMMIILPSIESLYLYISMPETYVHQKSTFKIICNPK